MDKPKSSARERLTSHEYPPVLRRAKIVNSLSWGDVVDIQGVRLGRDTNEDGVFTAFVTQGFKHSCAL
jgi:hypothetical protein